MLNKRNQMCKIPYVPCKKCNLEIGDPYHFNNPFYSIINKCLSSPNNNIIIILESDIKFDEVKPLLMQALSDFINATNMKKINKCDVELNQNYCIAYNTKMHSIERELESIEVAFKNGSKIEIKRANKGEDNNI